MATKKTKSTKNAPALRNAEPYKNSAGVKLPNADIIIEADASGAVTSCRNAATGEEYAGGSGKTAECIVSNAGTQAYIPVMIENGYYVRVVGSREQNLHLTVPIINGGLRIGTGYEEDIINYSGNITFDGEYYMITGDCTFTFNYE